MARIDPEIQAHKDWLGLLQPIGLVVSPPALVKAQAVPNSNVAQLQQKLLTVVQNPPGSKRAADAEPSLADLVRFLTTVLDWSKDDIAGAPDGPPMPDGLELILTDYNETLRPDLAVVDSLGEGQTLALVRVLQQGVDLDATPDSDARWSASPQAKFERLMREVKVPAGLLCNGDAIRLVYAPSGESSGHLTFPVAAMCEVSGRPILAALHMLVSEHRVFSAPVGRRLLDILVESRKYQAEVSTALSDQVLGALWELLRGFQASDPEDGRRVFDQTARENPQHVYGGLLTLLMRLIFVLYAEDEGLMPAGQVYANNYSVSGLYDRLRSDAGRYPDTMDQRYGAYASLLSLFRLVFDGGGHGGMRLPTRHGQLFNPDEYPFLEGRPKGVLRVVGDRTEAPRVSDGCIYLVLDALLMLNQERLSYRALDVEQIGSVYEAMMGYEVERAFGRSIALRPKHIVIDVDALLEVEGGKRNKWLKQQADTSLTGAGLKGLKVASTAVEVVAAFGRRVSPRSVDASGTPRLMGKGALYLQPGEERRRTGSHYTPRELTEPIVRTTLRPVLEALGDRPTPEQILGLKVCDPAMGSGAFLVEACRQLAEHLVGAWDVHEAKPKIPLDEEPLLHARRLVAQRCLYGVDKNPFAVSLAKLSLWLVTLARDHAFTFLDHSLKHGDSLVGLTRQQIASFHWKEGAGAELDLFEEKLREDLEQALGWRDTLQSLDEGDYDQMSEAWWEAESALADARLIGDLVFAAFFGAGKAQEREELRARYGAMVQGWRSGEFSRAELELVVEDLRGGTSPVPPMHWEVEYPEVFGKENPGFDAMVGNPPFMGGSRISTRLGKGYLDLLKASTPGAGDKADLVAYFFRRAYAALRLGGALGLIGTNSVAQGDTRESGLAWICEHGGSIYAAVKRLPWPGRAAVVVSVVHVAKGALKGPTTLDGQVVERISAFLFHTGGHRTPPRLKQPFEYYEGFIPYGAGFLFCDRTAGAHPLSTLSELLETDPECSEVVLPYLGGSELNKSPSISADRKAIYFGKRSLDEVERRWPALLQLLRESVKPERASKSARIARMPWWQFLWPRPQLWSALQTVPRVLACSKVSKHFSVAFVDSSVLCSNRLIVFAVESFGGFCVLQSSPHDLWNRLLSTTLKDDLQYAPSVSFETFPFPLDWSTNPVLETAGRAYYDFRSELMVRSDRGLTALYNQFHDPNSTEPAIGRLRELHAAMDRAVLDAYGWTDIPTDCEHFLDFEIDEETWGTKRKPYRYRWPDRVHDEVLARLLELNQQRHAEEVAAGLHGGRRTKTAVTKRRAGRPEASLNAQASLFGGSPASDA